MEFPQYTHGDVLQAPATAARALRPVLSVFLKKGFRKVGLAMLPREADQAIVKTAIVGDRHWSVSSSPQIVQGAVNSDFERGFWVFRQLGSHTNSFPEKMVRHHGHLPFLAGFRKDFSLTWLKL